MKNIVFFTGSGISKESGIQTFRDAGEGLWENFSIEEVCTHEAIIQNRKKVIDFYNMMRGQLLTKKPNAAHFAIADMQKIPDFNVQIVTQNVDDLHERAGSTHITHLHGELMKLRSSYDEEACVSTRDIPTLFEDGYKQRYEDRHPDGSLLRPFIVFFGEGVPQMTPAIHIAEQADVFVVIGTSLAVYPAASLLYYVDPKVPIYCIDPGMPELGHYAGRVTHIQQPASIGVPQVCELIKRSVNK